MEQERDFFMLLLVEGSTGGEWKEFLGGEGQKEFAPKEMEHIQVCGKVASEGSKCEKMKFESKCPSEFAGLKPLCARSAYANLHRLTVRMDGRSRNTRTTAAVRLKLRGG